MPTFELTANGATYQIEAPNEQAALDAFAGVAPKQAPTEEGSSLAGTAKSLGVGLAKGVIGLAGIPGDLASLATAAGTGQLEAEPTLGAKHLQRLAEGYTGKFYEPKGGIEQLANTVGQFAPALLGGPETLAVKLATRVGVPAIASEAAGALTDGNPYAKLGGALAGAAGATAAARGLQGASAARNAASAIPAGEDLVRTGSNQFNQARNMDVVVKPDFVQKTAADMRAALKDFDPLDAAQKDVFRKIDRLENLVPAAGGLPKEAESYAANLWGLPSDLLESPLFKAGRASVSGRTAIHGEGVAMNEIENVRKQLSKLRMSPDASTREAAKKAQEVLTRNQQALTAADAVSGDAQLYSRTMRDAVGNYGTGKRSAVLTGKQELAELNSGTAGSGANQDNNLRQAMKQLARPINNTDVPVARRLGFNDAEIESIRNAATGTRVGNTARYLGKLAPTGSVSGVMSGGTGFAIGGPAGAIGLPAAGYIAKRIGDLSTRRAVETLDMLVRSRSPLAAQVAAQLPPQIVQQLPARSQRLLQALVVSAPALQQPAQAVPASGY